MKPPVETYARAVYKPRAGAEFIVGLELEPDESFRKVQDEVRGKVQRLYNERGLGWIDGLDAAFALRFVIEHNWPKRWWFIETHLDDPHEGFVQMFQPPWNRDHLNRRGLWAVLAMVFVAGVLLGLLIQASR